MKVGRKSAWDTRIQPRLLEIAAWCRDGLTDIEISKALGISAPTLWKYKSEKKELLDSLKTNKAIADITVENSLYKRAVGYTHTETAEEVKKDKDGKIIFTLTKTVEKHIPADTRAAIRWLMNRKPDVWREQQPDHKKDIDLINVCIAAAEEADISTDTAPGAIGTKG